MCTWPQQVAILDVLSEVSNEGAVRPRDILDFLVETKESEAVAKEALLLRIQHNAMKAAPVHPSLSKDPKVRVEWLRVSKAVNSPDAKFPSPVADKPAGLSPVKYRGHEVEVRVAVEEEAVEEFLQK